MASSLTLLGLTLATLANSVSLELLISSEVRGAVYLVDAFSTECDAETYWLSSCSCYGGAARRVEAFEGRGDAVAVDTGAHFFGSGLFFNSFQGAAGAEFFAASKYDAWTLHFYDFSAADAADLPDDPTGGKWLAALIDSVRAADPDLGNPVATNLNVTGDPRRSSAPRKGGGPAHFLFPRSASARVTQGAPSEDEEQPKPAAAEAKSDEEQPMVEEPPRAAGPTSDLAPTSALNSAPAATNEPLRAPRTLPPLRL